MHLRPFRPRGRWLQLRNRSVKIKFDSRRKSPYQFDAGENGKHPRRSVRNNLRTLATALALLRRETEDSNRGAGLMQSCVISTIEICFITRKKGIAHEHIPIPQWSIPKFPKESRAFSEGSRSSIGATIGMKTVRALAPYSRRSIFSLRFLLEGVICRNHARSPARRSDSATRKPTGVNWKKPTRGNLFWKASAGGIGSGTLTGQFGLIVVANEF